MKDRIELIKGQFGKINDGFKSQSRGRKIAIVTGTIAVLLSIIFMFSYAQNNKYAILFSSIEAQDAANITAELEKRKVDMKIKGSTIYVDKKEVDKLRLELAPTISDGSKGFELMDESSSIGLTDEEFQIKKQRMIQGEIEKTIKSFSQVESARVHISQGEKSVFEKEEESGSAAVYVILKDGATLERNQVKSIISLVAGSVKNIPKENVDVIDGNMNLLSEGIIEDENNSGGVNTLTLSESKEAEAQLNKNLELSILKMLEPIFGAGRVKATVNTDLNFDSIVTTDLTIKPDKVAIKETRAQTSSQNGTTQGNGATDSNINNNNNAGNQSSEESTEESFEYAVGQTEVQTISTPGEVKRITASVAIDGDVSAAIINNVQEIVQNSIGMDNQRGDSVSVMAMEFDPEGKAAIESELEALKLQEQKDKLNKAVQMWLIGLVIAALGFFGYRRFNSNRTKKILNTVNENYGNNNVKNNTQGEETINPAKKKRNYILGDNDEMTLEEEVKLYASEKPDQVTEIIKTWLSE